MKIADLDCILLIDDDEGTNLLHTLAIESTNVDTFIQIVSGGEEALDFLTGTDRYATYSKYPQPGLILLDINMPGMNGWEFLAEYEKLPEERRGKTVLAMLTTSENPDDKNMARHFSSVSGFYQKPLTETMIEEIIYKYFPIAGNKQPESWEELKEKQ